jgi:hypothetical protein
MGRLLSEFFDLRSISLDLSSKTKELALAELIDSILVLNPECDRTQLFTAIIEQEKN